MKISVTQKSDGKVYTNDMSNENKMCILEIHFCTSYTQVIVQDEIDGKFTTHDIICDPVGTKPNLVDLIAIQDDETGVIKLEDSPND